MKKKILSLLALSLAFSCNAPNNIDNTLNNKSNSYIQQNGNEVVIDVSQGKFKGADLTLNIKDLNKFSVKQSTQGTVNLFNQVRSYMVYLVANSATTYPSNGDPISDKVLGPFVFNVNNNVFPSVRFTNVPPSGTNYYYFAVRAFDGINGTGTELIKPNNGSSTPWTGTSNGMPIAVSSGNGISVDNNFVPTPTTAPIVNVNTTLGATGAAVLDAKVKFLNTSSANVSGYEINLCTDPLNPTDTSVLATPFLIPKGKSFTDDIIQLTNIPHGTYYLTISKAGDENSFNPNLIEAMPPATYSDGSDNMVVSSNSVTVTNNQQYSFSDGAEWFKISVPLVTDVIYPVQSNPAHSIMEMNSPGIASDKQGNLFVSDNMTGRILKIASNGSVFNFVTGISGRGNIEVDSRGNLYAIDGNEVVRFDNTGSETLRISLQADGVTNLQAPSAVTFDGAGNIYIADNDPDSMIFRYDSTGNPIGASAFVGDGTIAGDVGGVSMLPTDALLNTITDMVVSQDGTTLYLSETGTNLVRKVSITDNFVITLAGGGQPALGSLRGLIFDEVMGIELDSLGNLYISDRQNHRIVKAFYNGTYSIFAGDGSNVPSNTLPLIKATDATLNLPYSLEVDQVGNLYINDRDPSTSQVRILKVTR